MGAGDVDRIVTDGAEALVGVYARVMRVEIAGGLEGDPLAVAEHRVRVFVEAERVRAEAVVGHPVSVEYVSIGPDPLTHSGFVSVSAALRFRVQGVGFWRPAGLRRVRFLDLDD